MKKLLSIFCLLCSAFCMQAQQPAVVVGAGQPNMKGYTYSFTPKSMPSAPKPSQQDRLCYGVNLSNLIGVDYVRKMIIQGKSAEEIKAMWQDDVVKFKKQRKPYLLYEE